MDSRATADVKTFFALHLVFSGKYCRTFADMMSEFFALPLADRMSDLFLALGFKIFSNVALRVKSLPTPALNERKIKEKNVHFLFINSF